jgi:3-phosphoglycerate kinase
MGVRNPVDFKVVENGETRNISLEDMHKSRGMIMDIGDGTVDKYSEDLQAKEIRIRAGPLGVYEKGFKNGIELTRRIAGDGLVFLGGDTSQEVVENGLDQHIISTGGQILISGGSALHRLAGGDFPSINLILEMYGR